ncbi:ion transporter [Sagittula salina]|uniref:Ion transporter n=1 Tax=Sagittula salina TaxID=2820268 RepID=A0A940MLU0_9RHOB|nr:ion transporter [Sagittula salina]MBP0483851.1 ion transporter [Sagittula salina]
MTHGIASGRDTRPLRVRLDDLLDGEGSSWARHVATTLYLLILLSALVITVQSIPDLPPALHGALMGLEVLLLGIFTLEYALRLWSAPDRLRYATSFWGVIDLMAILPALLFLLPDAQVLRTLRVMRVFRMLKLLRMRRALARIEYAIASSRDELILAVFMAAIMLFIAAVGIYQFEHKAQPEAFGSIPEALWWALATLTTVGYGDVYPITLGGRIFTAFVLLIGLGIVAIPAGVITSALMSAPEPTKPTDQRSDNGSSQ